MKQIVMNRSWGGNCTHTISGDVAETVPAAYGMGGGNTPLVVAVHEADGQDVTVLKETAYSLVTGGGKPGQGYPCVMIDYGST